MIMLFPMIAATLRDNNACRLGYFAIGQQNSDGLQLHKAPTSLHLKDSSLVPYKRHSQVKVSYEIDNANWARALIVC